MASRTLLMGVAKPPSSPTLAAILPYFLMTISRSSLFTALPMNMASEKVSAPMGKMQNSWKSKSLEVSLPPLSRLRSGTGSTCALQLT